MDEQSLGVGVAFLAGLISFVSPCVLPLVPAYLGHLIGATVAETRHIGLDAINTVGNRNEVNYDLKIGRLRLLALSHAALFVVGFSLVFITFWASINTLGALLPAYIKYIRPIGGFILIILGLNTMGLLNIKSLYRTFRIVNPKRVTFTGDQTLASKNGGFSVSFFTGVIFAAGWTPCVGPVLGGIIGLASERATALQGVVLLFAYSLGLGVPFLLCAVMLGKADAFLRVLNRNINRTRVVSLVSGFFIIVVGVLILTNVFQTLPRYFNWLPL
jgi:cytochrome c-type biogenesis protein